MIYIKSKSYVSIYLQTSLKTHDMIQYDIINYLPKENNLYSTRYKSTNKKIPFLNYYYLLK